MQLKIKDLCKSFPGNGQGPAAILDEICVEVGKGEFLSIVGPSGCGKSTLLEIIAGLQPCSSGEILANDQPMARSGLSCAIVFQQYGLFPWLTVRGNVEYGLKVKGIAKKERREISQTYLSMVRLDGYESYYPHELSGGMQQRVALARSLAGQPDILLLDEPFAALDALTKERCQQELLSIWHETGLTVIFVTHDVAEAVFLSDRILFLSRNPGRIIEDIEVPIQRPRNVEMRMSEEFRRTEHHARKLLVAAHESQASH